MRAPLGTSYPDVVAYLARAYKIFKFESLFVGKTSIGTL